MKVRRVTLQIEVPWELKAPEVLECLAQGFDEITYEHYGESAVVPHQVQVVGDTLSTNTMIGEIKQWPPR
jgi:hypothetical protein